MVLNEAEVFVEGQAVAYVEAALGGRRRYASGLPVDAHSRGEGYGDAATAKGLAQVDGEFRGPGPAAARVQMKNFHGMREAMRSAFRVLGHALPAPVVDLSGNMRRMVVETYVRLTLYSPVRCDCQIPRDSERRTEGADGLAA
jgi:hypothetical protein